MFVVYGSWGVFDPTTHAWGPLAVSLPDLAQNLLLYLPVGACGALAINGPPASTRAMAISLAAAVLLSAGVEVVQLHMADRTASVIDVLAAATGASAGAVAANLAARLAERTINGVPREFVTGSAGRLVAVIVLTAILIAWWPFDVTLDVSTVLDRLRAARAAFWFEDTISLAVVAKSALFASLGWILSRTMRRGAALRQWVVLIGAMAVFAAVLDAGQVLMGSRPAGFVTLCWQLTGIVAGAAAAAVSRSAP